MSNRYWVSGSGSWSDDDNHWATSSGGSGGDGNLPTSSDDVFFDANSFDGADQTVTHDVNVEVASISWSGATNTPTLAGSTWFYIHGSLTLISGMVYSSTGEINLDGTGSQTFTTGGHSFSCKILINSVDGDTDCTIVGDVTTDSVFGVYDGTCDFGNYNLTAENIEFSRSETTFGSSNVTATGSFAGFGFYTGGIVNMGSGTWTLNDQSGDWYVSGGTINSGTSTIEFTQPYCFFSSGGQTYNDILFTGGSVSRIENNFTVNNITFGGVEVGGYTPEYYIKGGTEITVLGDFTCSGSVGVVPYFYGELNNGSRFTLIKSGGSVECDYIELESSNATGGAHWYAGDNSTDSGNNRGWIFTDRKYPLPPFSS